jgi:hypothetical protein
MSGKYLEMRPERKSLVHASEANDDEARLVIPLKNLFWPFSLLLRPPSADKQASTAERANHKHPMKPLRNHSRSLCLSTERRLNFNFPQQNRENSSIRARSTNFID